MLCNRGPQRQSPCIPSWPQRKGNPCKPRSPKKEHLLCYYSGKATGLASEGLGSSPCSGANYMTLAKLNQLGLQLLHL